MVQALKTGDIDYVRGVLPDQFNALKTEPNIATVEGVANGYTELSFNTGGNKEGYGGSTAALTDPAFRDALGYAVDQQRLVDQTLGGYGTPGSTIIPPFHTRWHVEPDNPRTFDIEEANRRLDAAGYALDGSGKRLDKEGNVINLRMTWPDSEAENATNAQFIADWFGQLGITVTPAVTEEGALIEDVTGPPNGPANYDLYMWGWVGDPDPNSLLGFFQTAEIGGSSDSYYSNERYDELYTLQRQESDRGEAPRVPGRDAEPHLRRGAVHHPVLRRRAPRLPDRQVRRLEEPARSRAARRSSATAPAATTLLTDLTQASPAPLGRRAGPGRFGRATPAPSADGQSTSGQLVDAAADPRRNRPRGDHRRRPHRDAGSTGNGRGGMTSAGGSPPVDPAPSRQGSASRRSPARMSEPDRAMSSSYVGRRLVSAFVTILLHHADQLLPVPGDARLARTHHLPRDPERHRGDEAGRAGAVGPGQAGLPRPARGLRRGDVHAATSASRSWPAERRSSR